jgi:hypothetical protein
MIRKKTIQHPETPMIIDLTGPDGNAYVLLAIAKRLCSQLEIPFDKLQTDMTSGDYENLLNVFDEAFGDHVILER